MSDELDKFVLQYHVEMKGALERLEKLNSAVEKTGSKGEGAGKQLKEFANGASDEIGKVVPGVDKLSGAFKMIGAEAALAGIAVGALAVGIKAVMDMREQYNAQRKEGMEIGISALRLEEYQRKFVKASGGNITRDDTTAELKKLADFSSAVYRDPTRIGTEARTARVLGMDMGRPGEHKSVNDLMIQLGQKFDKMTEVQVQGFAKTIGMNQDFALGLKKQGSSVGNVTELTETEIKERVNAQKSLEQYNAALAQLEEQFNEMKMTLGQSLIPALTDFIKGLNDLFGWFHKFNAETNANMQKLQENSNKNTERLEKAKADAAKGDMRGMNQIHEEYKEKAYKDSGWYQLKNWWQNRNKSATPAAAAGVPAPDAAKAQDDKQKAAAAQTKASEAAAKKMKDMVDGKDNENEKARQIADQNALAINMFAGAVASFANAVDEKQAWAAWAGEVGKAAGLGSGPSDNTTQSGGPSRGAGSHESLSGSGRAMGKTQYDDIFNAAGKQYGVDPNLLKNIARVESQFDKNATSKVGATGIMQIMPSNFKGLGITDARDPTQNIIGGAKLFSEFLKKAKGDTALALRYYNGGFDQSRWGKENAAYAGKVLGGGQQTTKTTPGKDAVPGSMAAPAQQTVNDDPAPVRGESRAKIQLTSVQNTIAQRLGVPVNQLQQGGVNRGDVEWAARQQMAGMENGIFDLKNQLKSMNLTSGDKRKLNQELRAQESGLAMMRQYSGQVVEKSQDGGRSITIGERAIIINVNGAMNPDETAAAIKAHMDDHLSELVNGTATVVKR